MTASRRPAGGRYSVAWGGVFFYLTSVCWTFGFAPYARVSFFSRQKRNQKGSPLPRPCAALRVPSFRRRSRGRQNGPSLARLCLSRHPCRSTPSTTTPLGLRPRGGQIKIKSQIKSRSRAPLPLPLSRKRERGDESPKPRTPLSPLSRLRERA